jgi:hypothetical protein
VYGGVTEKLADGDHLVQGKAAVNGMTASAATVLSVGARSN